MDDQTLLQEIRSRGFATEDDEFEFAVDKLLMEVTNMPANWENWDYSRKTIAAKQVVCFLFFKEKELDVSVGRFDGLMGTLTRNAFDTYARVSRGESAEHRPDPSSVPLVSSDKYVINTARRNALPLQANMMSYYGNVGTNQVEILLPYRFRYDWDRKSSTSKMTCHKKAADEFSGIFETIRDHYGIAAIQELGLDLWGGTLNVRKKRGGTTWSMHSWGVAIDICPDGNELHTPWQDAKFSRKEFIPFINAWLGMGWVSLGYDHNFDSMHFQRARVR